MMRFLPALLAATVQAIPLDLETGGHPIPADQILIPQLQQAIDPEQAADLILLHYNNKGYPAVGVEVEDVSGRRKILIDVARYGEIQASGAPPRTTKVAGDFFGDLAGQWVNKDQLDARLTAFQNNPFHRAIPRLQASEDGSQVNALLRLEQSKAREFSLGYADTGASPLPRERIWLDAAISDWWQRSSLTNARVTIAPDPAEFHALQIGTRFFQINGHEFLFNALYSGSNGDGAVDFDAYTWQVSAAWRGPKKRLGSWKWRHKAGLSFRRTNNALEFGDRTAQGLADAFQVSIGQEWEREWDRKHLTRISGSLTLAPGGLTGRSDDDAHDSLRPGAQGRYTLARLLLWHRHQLPRDFQLVASAGGQWASDPVIQADQITLGGASGVKGLPEQFGLGDHGLITGLELRTPVWSLPRKWQIRPAIFLQAGRTWDKAIGEQTDALTSGVGLQTRWKQHLQASISAGWRLDEGGSELHTFLNWTF